MVIFKKRYFSGCHPLMAAAGRLPPMPGFCAVTPASAEPPAGTVTSASMVNGWKSGAASTTVPAETEHGGAGRVADGHARLGRLHANLGRPRRFHRQRVLLLAGHPCRRDGHGREVDRSPLLGGNHRDHLADGFGRRVRGDGRRRRHRQQQKHARAGNREDDGNLHVPANAWRRDAEPANPDHTASARIPPDLMRLPRHGNAEFSSARAKRGIARRHGNDFPRVRGVVDEPPHPEFRAQLAVAFRRVDHNSPGRRGIHAAANRRYVLRLVDGNDRGDIVARRGSSNPPIAGPGSSIATPPPRFPAGVSL
ncbi:MAG: hypothetical protein V9E96_20115 [Chitinophagaceae bacterium]